MKYTVTVRGCHDDSRVSVDLAPEQAEAVTKVAEMVTALAVGCKPDMTVEKEPGLVVDAATERQEVEA